MLNDIPIDEMTRIIGLATALAFLLGAVAGLLSLLFGRLDQIMNRSRRLHAIEETDTARSFLKADIPRTMKRATSIRLGIGLCSISGVLTGWMVVLVFVDALFAMQNNQAIALMFIGAMTLFTTALFSLLFELVFSQVGLAHFEP